MKRLAECRYAVRSLVRAPVLAVAAIGSLTLGIATATVVFSLISAAILRPPPFPEGHRLAVLHVTQESPGRGVAWQRWSWPRFQLLSRGVTSFDEVGTFSSAVLTLTGDGSPEPLAVEIVSNRTLPLLGAPIVQGRAFLPSEDAVGSEPVVVIGDELWRRRFGGAAVLGRVIRLNGVPATIVGVVGPGFRGLSAAARAWIPSSMAPRLTYDQYLTTNQNFISVVGRLASDRSLAEANGELAVLGSRIHREAPSEVDTPDDRFSAAAVSLNDARVDGTTRRALVLLAGAVGVLFLIACANVASLLLGRAAARRKEMAVRLAVGASRWRLVRLLLVESGVIAGIAAGLGSLVAAWVLVGVRVPPSLARGRNFYGAVGEFATATFDGRVLGFVVAVAALSVVLFGLVPALQSTNADIATTLRGGVARRGPVGLLLREMAVGVQVALAAVLLVGCGLLLTSYQRLRSEPIGIETGNLLTFMIRPNEVLYPPAAAPGLLDRILAEIAAVPGVVSATVDGCAPLTMTCARGTLRIVGRGLEGEAPVVRRHYVAPGHLATLGIPLVAGRDIAVGDRVGAPRVVVINQAAAERFWPGANPIGQRVWFEGAPGFGSADSSAEVIGIAANAAYQPLDDDPVQPDFFTPYPQFTYAGRMVLVRTQGPPLPLVGPVAKAVERADAALALFDVQTMEQRARASWSKRSAETGFFFAVAGIALLLAVGGVYAVTSFFVTTQLREIGIRMALGASAARVVRGTLGRTARLGIWGGLLGLAGAMALSRLVAATLYETSPLSLGAYLGAAAALVTGLVTASWLPARRATNVEPVEVLREG